MTPLQLYLERCNHPHNIDQHLPTIRHYASLCRHVTEFGVDRGWSTSALIAAHPDVVVSFDLVRCEPEVSLLEEVARNAGIEFQFNQADTRRVLIEETDLLLVDSDHTYEQVRAELTRNVDRVRKYLVFHDTYVYPAIVQAIDEFAPVEEWERVVWTTKQNGLAVLERRP